MSDVETFEDDTALEYGPVELILAAFPDEDPDAGVLAELAGLNEAGVVRVIDMLLVSRDDEGEVTYVEIDSDEVEIGAIDLAAAGLASDDDVIAVASQLAPGTSAVLLVVELLWAKNLASRLAAAGGFVVDSTRIPAPVVNLVAAEAAAEIAEELAEELEEELAEEEVD